MKKLMAGLVLIGVVLLAVGWICSASATKTSVVLSATPVTIGELSFWEVPGTAGVIICPSSYTPVLLTTKGIDVGGYKNIQFVFTFNWASRKLSIAMKITTTVYDVMGLKISDPIVTSSDMGKISVPRLPITFKVAHAQLPKWGWKLTIPQKPPPC